MNSRPPQSPHALDAEERALVKVLPRLHGRTAPGPDLDASILAAAQAAVQPAKPGRASVRPRIRWMAPAALAASMVLAVGMAWQLRPLPKLQPPQAASSENAASERVVLMTVPAASDTPLPMVDAPPGVAEPRMPARQQANPAAASAQQAMPPSPDDLQPSAALQLPAAPPSPPAPFTPAPAPVAPSPVPAAMAAKTSPATESQAGSLQAQASQEGLRARATSPAAAANAAGMAQAPTADKASVADSARPAATSTARAAPAVAEVRKEAVMAADAGFVDAPEEDIPPATAASPDVRDAWLRRITQLLEQGKRQDAKASLAEFKRRYPNAVLPPALKAFDIEP